MLQIHQLYRNTNTYQIKLFLQYCITSVLSIALFYITFPDDLNEQFESSGGDKTGNRFKQMKDISKVLHVGKETITIFFPNNESDPARVKYSIKSTY